jgi:hypothetical protein
MEFGYSIFEDELVRFQEQEVRFGVTVGLLPEYNSQQVAQELLVDSEELIQQFEKFVGAVIQYTLAEVLHQPKV